MADAEQSKLSAGYAAQNQDGAQHPERRRDTASEALPPLVKPEGDPAFLAQVVWLFDPEYWEMAVQSVVATFRAGRAWRDGVPLAAERIEEDGERLVVGGNSAHRIQKYNS